MYINMDLRFEGYLHAAIFSPLFWIAQDPMEVLIHPNNAAFYTPFDVTNEL